MSGDVLGSEDHVSLCEKAIRDLFATRGVELHSIRRGGSVLSVDVKGHHQTWELRVDCFQDTRGELPKIELINIDKPLSHVAPYGVVCISDNQGLSIDKNRPWDVIAYALVDAYELLERSIVDAVSGMHEFFNELEGYWGGFKSLKSWSYLQDEQRSRQIDVYVPIRADESKALVFLDVKGEIPTELKMEDFNRSRGLYLALDGYIPVPAPSDKLDSRLVSDLLEGLNGANLALWNRYLSVLSTARNHTVKLLLSVPRKAGTTSMVGLQFGLKGRKIDRSYPLQLLQIARHTNAYMRERGGANLSLADKHVAVLGCGSVGSEIADALASSGVGSLTLVDHDVFNADNVFRHVLGRDAIGTSKVWGLKCELLRKYPGVRVKTFTDKAADWMRQSSIRRYDAVVVAIGQPSIERQIHSELVARKCSYPIIFSWLDPLDLGGHAVVVTPGTRGCLECLYQDAEGDESLIPRTTFLAPNQKVTKSLTGCASFFVPYGAIQSRQTGLLAATLVVESLLGPVSLRYRFWRGAGTIALANGLTPSLWWKRAQLNDIENPNDLPFEDGCRACRCSK